MEHAPQILITCHVNADWDALASMIGASLLYPGSVLVFPGSMERQVTNFFNETVKDAFNCKAVKDIDADAITTVVVVDTCQRNRIAHIDALLGKDGIAVHVWDHHPPEPGSIDAEVYHTADVGSTCTLITEALRRRGVPLTPEQATMIGLGIYGDTGAFTYTSTTPRDFEAAAWLLASGMQPDRISRLTQQDLTSEHVRLLNELIESAVIHELGGVEITFAEARMDSFVGDFAVVAQRFMEMEPTQALFAFGILDDRTQVVARSRVDELDVGVVCKALGGGGHRYAASAPVKDMPLPELKDAIFQQIYAQLNPHRQARELMSSPAVGIEEKTSLTEAETTMTRYGLKAIPVFKTGSRHCVGLLEAHTASLAVSHGLGHLPVHIYMHRNPFTVSPDAPLQTLMDIIVGSRQRLVPVVEDNEVIGVVTRTDLINMFVEDQGRLPLPRSEGKEKNLSRLLAGRLPRKAHVLLRRAGELGDKLGVNVYAVGGFVRDIILARPGKELDDIDLVVEGDALAFARALAGQMKGRLREHQAFLTALVIFTDEDGEEQRIDIATARLEYYLYPAALPTVELSSIKMDLFRRDFTINAMALRLNADQFGFLVDFFGGQNDIQRKTIRVLHALSFIEDPTRILRAVRFAQRYQFRLAAQTTRLIKNALELGMIDKLSGQRIVHEFNAVFREKAPLRSLDQFHKLGILEAIHPALAPTPARHKLIARLQSVIDWYRMLYLSESFDISLVYFLVITSNMRNEDLDAVLNRLSLPASLHQTFLRIRKQIWQILPALSTWEKRDGKLSELRALLAPLPIEGALYLMARAPSEKSSEYISLYINRWRLIKADMDGKDLIALGLEPGPVFGSILKTVLAAKLDGEVESREEQLALARRLVAKHLAAHPESERFELDPHRMGPR